jgi:hypothetical protein
MMAASDLECTAYSHTVGTGLFGGTEPLTKAPIRKSAEGYLIELQEIYLLLDFSIFQCCGGSFVFPGSKLYMY